MLWYEYDEEEHIASEKELSYSEGKTEGCQLMLELVSRMLQDGLTGEIERLKEDEDFCNSMFEKYHLL